MLQSEDIGNIILHQINSIGDMLTIQETKPSGLDSSLNLTLQIVNKKLKWVPQIKFESGNDIIVSSKGGIVKIDASIDTRLIINDKLKETNIHYLNGRMGLGRAPLHSYKFDISVPENKLMTAFHVGDGKYGFSMGNGTAQGFIPEIIGMGSDENDAGLYLIGRAGNSTPSTIPLTIIDGRNHIHQKVTNRPIFGVTNADYNEYLFLIDQNGLVGVGKKPEIYKMEINGIVKAADFLLDSSVSLHEIIEIIVEQKNEIDKLKDRITQLETP